MSKTVLVLGATGYVGTRLVSQLLETKHSIRVAYRSMSKIEDKHWHGNPRLEYIYVDVFEKNTLSKACENVDIVYYLVHSMLPDIKNFADMEKKAAENMVEIAEAQGVELLIYLGGLGDDKDQLSKHLRSRAEVGKILKAGKVPTTILRAAIIIGSGSSSFEVLRYIVEHLPIMPTPKWVYTKNQPICIRDVLNYLVGVIGNPDAWGKILDIGGPEILTYKEFMEIYAEEAGLWKRWIIPMPLLSSEMSAAWAHLITPLDKTIARPLVEGLRNEVVMENHEIHELVPQKRTPIREAIRRGLKEQEFKISHTQQTVKRVKVPVEYSSAGDPEWSGGTFIYNRRAIRLRGNSKNVWRVIKGIGGRNGWFYGNFLWKVMGALDELIGGVGMRRGRQDPNKLIVGQTVDLWRVSNIQEGKFVILHAEMRIPGLASMKLEIHPSGKPGEFLLEQYAAFVPRGLGGLVYWYFFLPLHMKIFDGMLMGIAKTAKVEIIGKPVRLSKRVILGKS